jgi:hypothetical protein
MASDEYYEEWYEEEEYGTDVAWSLSGQPSAESGPARHQRRETMLITPTSVGTIGA